MAVKQYSLENNHRSENLKYNITKILEYIEELKISLDNNQYDGVSESLNICKKIVHLLGKNFSKFLLNV